MRGTPWPTILYIYTTLYSSPCTHTFKLIRKRNTPAPPLLQCSGAQTASTPPHSTPAQFYQTRLGSLHPIPENTSLRAYIYIVNTNRTINTFPPNTLLGTTPTLPHTTRTKPSTRRLGPPVPTSLWTLHLYPHIHAQMPTRVLLFYPFFYREKETQCCIHQKRNIYVDLRWIQNFKSNSCTKLSFQLI